MDGIECKAPEHIPTLETERLILRPFAEDDFAAVHSYGSNPENVKYMVWGPNSEEDTRKFLSETIEKGKRNPALDYDFAVTLKETGKLIGGGGVYLNPERSQGMMGWILHMDYWKRGFGTEFCAELIRFSFEELGLHRVWATCNAENYGSYRVMERNGMRREAHFVQARYGRVHDEHRWYDEYHYGILRDEWMEKRDK